MITKNQYIKIANNEKQKIITNITKPVIYQPTKFGIEKKYAGKNVTIAVIDSGCPKHPDIKEPKEMVNFCDNCKDPYDTMGHSTIITGILQANNKKTIIGMIPKSEIYQIKTVNNNQCNFNAIVAAILWAIIKKVDIIIMAIGTKYNYEVLHDTIKKAHKNNIVMITAANNNDNVNYPSQYKETLSVGNNKKFAKNIDIIVPNNQLTSTYINDKYIQITGSSVHTAIVTGITALIIEKYKEKHAMYSPKIVYDEIKRIFNK